ncbi:MAG TPA: zf-TFIIB domain-containing protein [Candidatus Krumholzibacteria bacterium]|nr:zf-TFIIB domain-containing protein [Candidatus Krumholzibacteria bacterium]
MPNKPAAKKSSAPRPRKSAAPAARASKSTFAATRKRLDAKRAKRRAKMLWVHYWLLCPKCGGDMFVQETLGIRYEVCRDCHGIAIDGVEAELLLEHLDPGKALRAILKQSKKPDTSEI